MIYPCSYKLPPNVVAIDFVRDIVLKFQSSKSRNAILSFQLKINIHIHLQLKIPSEQLLAAGEYHLPWMHYVVNDLSLQLQAAFKVSAIEIIRRYCFEVTIFKKP